MRTLIAFLLLASTAMAGTPCDDARKDFQRARRFGAYEFRCQDRYDGTATSSWKMDKDGFKQFLDNECQRKMRRKPAPRSDIYYK